MTDPHLDLTISLLRAALDPANHQRGITSKLDLPTGRLVAAAAHADADDEGMDRITNLAGGLALASIGLTAEIAGRDSKTPDQLLDDLALTVAGDEVATLMVQVVRATLNDPADGVEILGHTLADDLSRFLDLLLELAHYCGTSILALQADGTPAEETLADLQNALRDKDTDPEGAPL
ncbi:hypothetical protein AB4225_29400 [Streptomyces sp. 2RAF24]|uniref:hypothetical protein n=1 Tax=Streptomyces sp. 2RAF24 TaxID=3232997 RepID=UPI003F970D5E